MRARSSEDLGYDGAGVGVAVIDSGVTTWHDDLTYQGSSRPCAWSDGQRVAKFVDFVNGRTTPYDDNGHGTHVAGIIAGNGFDSLGAPRRHRAGRASGQPEGARRERPRRHQRRHRGARLGRREQDGLQHPRHQPVGWRAVTESYKTDPLTLAAKRAVDAGIVVVTAAGNLGKNAARPDAVRRDHGAGQRAVGADGRRVQPPGHGRRAPTT